MPKRPKVEITSHKNILTKNEVLRNSELLQLFDVCDYNKFFFFLNMGVKYDASNNSNTYKIIKLIKIEENYLINR